MKPNKLRIHKLRSLLVIMLLSWCVVSGIAQQVNISNGAYYSASITAPAGSFFYRIHTFKNNADPLISGQVELNYPNAPTDNNLGFREIILAKGNIDLASTTFYNPLLSPFSPTMPLNGIAPIATGLGASTAYGTSSFFSTPIQVSNIDLASNEFFYLIEKFESKACPSGGLPNNFVTLDIVFKSTSQTLCNTTSGSNSSCPYSNSGNIQLQHAGVPSMTANFGAIPGSNLNSSVHLLTEENNCAANSRVGRKMTFTLNNFPLTDPQVDMRFNRTSANEHQLLEADPNSVRISFTLYTDPANTLSSAIIADGLTLDDFKNPVSGTSNFNVKKLMNADGNPFAWDPVSIVSNVADPVPTGVLPTQKYANNIITKPSLKDNGVDEALVGLTFNFSNLNALASSGSGGISTSSTFNPTGSSPNFLVIYPGSTIEISYEAEFINSDDFSDGTAGSKDYSYLKEEVPFLHTEYFKWAGATTCGNYFNFHRGNGNFTNSKPTFDLSAHPGGFMKGSDDSHYEIWDGDIETMVVDMPAYSSYGMHGINYNGYPESKDPLAVDWEHSIMEFEIELERGFSIPCPNSVDHSFITGMFGGAASTSSCTSINFGNDQSGAITFREGAPTVTPTSKIPAPLCGSGNLGTGSYLLPKDVFEIRKPNGDVIYPDEINIEPILVGGCDQGQRWKVRIPMNRLYGYYGSNKVLDYAMGNADLRFKVQGYCPASEPTTQYTVKAYIIPAYCDQTVSPTLTYTTLPISPNNYVNGTCNTTIDPSCSGERNRWLVGKTGTSWSVTCPGCKTPGVAVIKENPVRHEDFIGWKDNDDDGIADMPLDKAPLDSINRNLIRHGDVMTLKAFSYLYDPAVYLDNSDSDEACASPKSLWGPIDEFNTNALANPPAGGTPLILDKWVFDINFDGAGVSGRGLFYPLIKDAIDPVSGVTRVFTADDDLEYDSYHDLAQNYPSAINVVYDDGTNPIWQTNYVLSEDEIVWLTANDFRVVVKYEDVYAALQQSNSSLPNSTVNYFSGNDKWKFEFALQFITDVDRSAYNTAAFIPLGNATENAKKIDIGLTYEMYVTSATAETLLVDKAILDDHPFEYERAVNQSTPSEVHVSGSTCAGTHYPAFNPTGIVPSKWWCEKAGGNIQLAAYSDARFMFNQHSHFDHEHPIENYINTSDDLAPCIEVGPIIEYRTGSRGNGSSNHFYKEIRPGAMADSVIFYVPAPFQPEAVYLYNRAVYGAYTSPTTSRTLSYIIPLTGSKSMVGINGITVSAAPTHTMPDEFYPINPSNGMTYAGTNGGTGLANAPLFSTANKVQHWKVSIPLAYFHQNEGTVTFSPNGLHHLDGANPMYTLPDAFPMVIGDEQQTVRAAIYYSPPGCNATTPSTVITEDCAFRRENNSFYYYSGRTEDVFGIYSGNSSLIAGMQPALKGMNPNHGLQVSDYVTLNQRRLHPSVEETKLMLPSCLPNAPLKFASSSTLKTIETNVKHTSNYRPEFERMSNSSQMEKLFQGAVPPIYVATLLPLIDATHKRTLGSNLYAGVFTPYLFFDQRANLKLTQQGNTSPIVDANGEFEFEFELSDDLIEELTSITAPSDFNVSSGGIITTLNQNPHGYDYNNKVTKYQQHRAELEGLYFYLEPDANGSNSSPANLMEHIQILSVSSPYLHSSIPAFVHNYNNGSLSPIKFADNTIPRLFALPTLRTAPAIGSSKTIKVKAKFDCLDPAIFAQLDNVTNSNTTTSQEFPFKIVVNYNCDRNKTVWNPTNASDWQSGVNTSQELMHADAESSRCINNRTLSGYFIDAPTLDFAVELLPDDNLDPCSPSFKLTISNQSDGALRIESSADISASGLTIPSNVSYPILLPDNGSFTLSGLTPQTASCISQQSNFSIVVNASSYCASCDLATATACLTKTATYDYLSHPIGVQFDPAAEVIVDANCGMSNGGATVHAIDGCGAIGYVWNTGATGATLSNVPTGIYTVTATDVNGCSSSTTVSIGSLGGTFALSVSNDVTICEGDATSLLASGGTNYSWSPTTGLLNPNSSNPTASPTATTVYNVSSTDGYGCVGTGQVKVTVNNGPSANAGPDQTICLGNSVALGGNPTTNVSPASYVWGPPSGISNVNLANPVVTPTATTTYTVTVSDGYNCSSTDDVTIYVTEEIEVQTEVVCSEDAEQPYQFNVTVAGGLAPYTYELYQTGVPTVIQTLSSSSTSVSFLIPQLGVTYTLLVTDANGCSQSLTNLTVPTAVLGVQLDLVDPATCSPLNDGTLKITANGGSVPYTYNWDGPNGFTSTAEDLTGVAAGVYTVTVTDAMGCTTVFTQEITNESDVEIDAEIVNVACRGSNAGVITAVVSNGTAPYSYQWSNGETTATINNLSSGTYTVSVTDDNGCEQVASFTVVITNSFLVNALQTIAPSCAGGSDGSVVLNLQGGALNYQLNSNGPGTFPMAQTVHQHGQVTYSGFSSGNFSITVTDNNGCLIKIGVTIPEAEPMEVEDLQLMRCPDQRDGFANLYGMVVGGVAPYSVSFNGQTQTTAINGVFSFLNVPVTNTALPLIITDANGCILNQSVITASISGYSTGFQPTFSPATSATNATCNNGTVSIVPNVSHPSIRYSIDGGSTWSTQANYTGLTSGTYTLAMAIEISVGGHAVLSPCVSYYNIVVKDVEMDLSILSVENSLSSCGFGVFGCREIVRTPAAHLASGKIHLNISGGTPPYQIRIKRDGIVLPAVVTSQSSYWLTSLDGGLYELEVEDNTGCISPTIIQLVGQQVAFQLIHSVFNNQIGFGVNAATCHCPAPGYTVKIYQVQPNGGLLLVNGPYSANPNGVYQSTQAFVPGEYIVETRDCYGCVSRTPVKIGGRLMETFKRYKENNETDNPEAIDLLGVNKVVIAPNPSEGQNTTLKYRLTNNAKQLTVFDLSGQELFTTHLNGKGGEVLLPVQTFRHGMYMVEVVTDKNERFREKLLIVRNN